MFVIKRTSQKYQLRPVVPAMNSGQASGAPFSTCLKQATHTALGQDCCLVPLELPAVRPSPQTVIAESAAPPALLPQPLFSLSPHLY